MIPVYVLFSASNLQTLHPGKISICHLPFGSISKYFPSIRSTFSFDTKSTMRFSVGFQLINRSIMKKKRT